MSRRLLVALALLSCLCGVAHAQKIVTFAFGTAQVRLPDTFVATERNDGSLRATFGATGDHRLELSVTDVVGSDGATGVGEAFIRAQAEERQLKLFGTPGRAILMEPADDSTVDGKAYRSARWRIGFDNSVVVMTLTAPVQMSPELRRFLGQQLDDVITSVRRKTP